MVRLISLMLLATCTTSAEYSVIEECPMTVIDNRRSVQWPGTDIDRLMYDTATRHCNDKGMCLTVLVIKDHLRYHGICGYR